MAHETVNFHPLVNTVTTTIARDDLLAFLAHRPRAADPRFAGPACPEAGPIAIHADAPFIGNSAGRGIRPISDAGEERHDDAAERRRSPAAADDLVKETTTQTFVKDVIEESKRQPVLVDFWAPWCGPCKQLTPILEKAVKAAKGKVKLVKMNIDEHPAIPGQLGIQSIPAVIAFVNGQPVDGFMGALPESQVTGFIERLTKGRAGAETEDPDRGGRCGAGRGRRRAPPPSIYRADAAEEPPTCRRSPGWRAASRDRRRLEQAKQTLALVPEAKRNDPAVAAARAAIELAEQAELARPGRRARAKVAANPLDHQARFDLALALNAERRARGGGRPAPRDRQARPQMERRRRAQAARAVLRGLGTDRRGDAWPAARAVVAAVFLIVIGPVSS